MASVDGRRLDRRRRGDGHGHRVFRYETFGDEVCWGDTLNLHRAIAGAKLGGVGLGVSVPLNINRSRLSVVLHD